MWLQVGEEEKLEQVIKQVEKLEDVRKIVYRHKNDNFFLQLEELVERI